MQKFHAIRFFTELQKFFNSVKNLNPNSFEKNQVADHSSWEIAVSSP